MWRVLISSLSTLSLSGCLLVMFNPESSRFYLICVGRQEAFRSNLSIQFLFKAVAFLRYDPTDSYKQSSPRGFMMKGSIWNLTRVILNLMSLSMFVLVPMFYLAIFKFRRNQVDTMSGKLIKNQLIWDFWTIKVSARLSAKGGKKATISPARSPSLPGW